MSYYGPVLAVTAIILLTEILTGRHRGIYRRDDLLVIGLCALLNPLVTRSLAGLLIAGAAALVLPQGKGALAHLPLLPSYIVLFLLVLRGQSAADTEARAVAQDSNVVALSMSSPSKARGTILSPRHR